MWVMFSKYLKHFRFENMCLDGNIHILGLSKTYNTNAMVPDSAATAFAMYSGVKTNFFTMGFDSNIQVKVIFRCEKTFR